jgi:hypothetical protein
MRWIFINDILTFFFIGLFFSSCSNDVKSINNEGKLESSHKLVKIGSKEFNLDKETAPQSNQFQIFRAKDSSEILTFLNSYNNSIYFYDFDNEEFLYKKTFEKEGDNGVGSIFGYHIHNLDSIFIYNYGMSKLFLFDSAQSMINSYEINQNQKFSPTAKVATNSPIVILNNLVYMTGNIAGEYSDETAENRPVLLKLDLETKEFEYQISYPAIFREANWGGGQYRWLSHYYNPVDSLMFFSFSVSHDLKFLDLKSGDVFNQYMGSNYITEIPSVSSTSLFNSISKEKIRNHFIINGSYQQVGFVLSDEYYFRKVWLPEKNFDPRNFNGFKTTLILMNRDFEKIGEMIFSPRSYGDFVISSSGLSLKKYTDKEDVLIFDQFKLKEIE